MESPQTMVLIIMVDVWVNARNERCRGGIDQQKFTQEAEREEREDGRG